MTVQHTQHHDTLSYRLTNTKPPVGDADREISAFRAEYMGNLETYARDADLRESARRKVESGSLQVVTSAVRVVIPLAVGSIKTPTEKWENLARSHIRGNIDATELVAKTTDGDVKAEKVAKVMNSPIPRMTAIRLMRGDVTDARRVLIGRHPGLEGDWTDETYLRATKSAFVTWLLGFDTECFDSRYQDKTPGVRRAIFQPTGTTGDDRVRHRANADREKRQPTGPKFAEEELKWSIREYDEYTGEIRDYIAQHAGIPADRVKTVVFNSQEDDKTIHERILNVLGA